MTPVTDKGLELARRNEVLLEERYSAVNVMNINSTNVVETATTKMETTEKNASHAVNA